MEKIMSIISDNIKNNIKPSLTLLVDAKANELKAQGYSIISLGIGEPDFDTPINIKNAAIKAINDGYTKYTAAGGVKELKEAIINKFKRENNLEYKLNEIIVSSGAKQVIYNAFMATINPGDEVIIISPYWVSDPEMVKIANGVPIIINSDYKKDFTLVLEEIEKSITPQTKWLMINSPNNPCGSVYGYNELKALANMILKYDNIHILSDDIYEHLTYDDEKFFTLAEIEPSLKNRILTVNGLSKTYAMTGWRIGYGAGSAELIKAMVIVQSQSTSGACSISQMAAIEALNGTQDFIKERNIIFKSRRDMVAEKLNKVQGLKCNKPKGSFYLFVNCFGLFGKKTQNGQILENSNDVATYLLEKAHIAVVSGSAFGVEGYFRISYATSEENLIESCRKIKEACDLL